MPPADLGKMDEILLYSKRCLVMLFKPRPTLYLLEDYPGNKFVVNGESYCRIPARNPSREGYIGLYDWLRSTTGNVIGVRFFLIDECADFLKEHRKKFSYIKGSDAYLDIFFNEDYNLNEEISSDQAFGSNSLYVSNQNEYAMTLGTDWLTQFELDSILTLG